MQAGCVNSCETVCFLPAVEPVTVAQAFLRGSLSPKSYLIRSLQINKEMQVLDGVV